VVGFGSVLMAAAALATPVQAQGYQPYYGVERSYGASSDGMSSYGSGSSTAMQPAPVYAPAPAPVLSPVPAPAPVYAPAPAPSYAAAPQQIAQPAPNAPASFVPQQQAYDFPPQAAPAPQPATQQPGMPQSGVPLYGTMSGPSGLMQPPIQAGTPNTIGQTHTSSISDFESFPYDPKSDPAVPAYVTPKAHDSAQNPKIMTMGTRSGFDLGAQFSGYRYQEHLVPDSEFMHIAGVNFGVTLDATKAFENQFFLTGNLRGTYGSHEYKGGDVDINTGATIPSKHSGEDDFMFEARLLGGYDFMFPEAFNNSADISISPYIGLGFRYLDNDGSGADTNGVDGYERYSHYFYLPVGVNPRIRVSNTSRVSMNLEYDQLLYGWQVSSIGDAFPGTGDITNNQHGGYGLRGNVMYEWPKWAIGPFFNYWNINQSDIACNSALCGVEPHNQTIEYGIQGKYHF
jgi:hypothetical protein